MNVPDRDRPASAGAGQRPPVAAAIRMAAEPRHDLAGDQGEGEGIDGPETEAHVEPQVAEREAPYAADHAAEGTELLGREHELDRMGAELGPMIGDATDDARKDRRRGKEDTVVQTR